MDEGFIGEIRLFGGNFAPRNWAFCQGQLLAISSNNALFSILGTTYGGDGRTTFGLPDLRSRLAVHTGSGPGLSDIRLGQQFGIERNNLNVANLPVHSHQAVVTGDLKMPSNADGATTDSPVGAHPAVTDNDFYADSNSPGEFSGSAIIQGKSTNSAATGGNQPIDNMMPYIGCHYIICLYGVYPSRS